MSDHRQEADTHQVTYLDRTQCVTINPTIQIRVSFSIPDAKLEVILVNLHPGGVFPDSTRRWGRIYHPPRLELPENVVKFYLKFTDNVTRHIEAQIVDFLSSLASPGKTAMAN